MRVSALRYERMYAWWQCVKTWASLKFDDHRGLVPKALVMEGGNLQAILTRTKTSGKDKRIEALPVHISADAYLLHPEVGTWWSQVVG